ncbi:ABC transporter ATP-binding protein [Desulfitibacter alkalitolerans]|uniref:ABC transporter ATP-binding protein n=1 Tax=Desulfitibacter alkalitolerans TaxID=264641 RepID=UPI00068805CB|nr:ABC transporter ATP-binding protein [Desulfitibacter alkalitolerans]
MTLEIKEISKTINGMQILDKIQFTAPRGTLTILCGHNGAGKTTLLRILAGLVKPTWGSIVWQSNIFTHHYTYRRFVGYAGHELMLYENLTARENLLLFAKLYKVKNPMDEIEILGKSIGYLTYMDQIVANLSKGMRQKVSIARSLLHNPQIVLMDEPFTGLDIRSKERLETIIKDLLNQEKCIIIALHDIEKLAYLAHQMVFLNRGTISHIEFSCGKSKKCEDKKLAVSGGE